MTANLKPGNKRRYWRNLAMFTLAAICVGALALVYIGFPYYQSYGWAHPNSPPVCCVTPTDIGLAYHEAEFETRDGLTLRGWYIPSENRAAVILAHPIGANRIAMLDAAQFLARHGFGVLLFDLRTHGDSEGEVLPFGGDEAEDMVAAVEFLQAQNDVDPDRIGAMGFSLGAQVSIFGAARTDQIKAVVADAPCCTVASDFPFPHKFKDWLYLPYDQVFFMMLKWRTGVAEPVSVQEALPLISPRPIMLIGGGSEQAMLTDHYRAALEPKQLWIIPEAGHIGGLHARPAEYEERVIEFFTQSLLQ